LGDNDGDNFGRAVAMSDDGNRIVVGAYGVNFATGILRVFDWDGTAWVQAGTDIVGVESGEELGYSVSISADGSRIAAGARSYLSDEGATRIYEWDGTDWTIVGSEIVGEAANDDAGWSVMLSASGNHIVIGARDSHDGGSDSGHVRVYEWNGSAWVQMGTDIAGEATADEFGFDVSISSDGQRIIGGALYADPNGSRSGSARVFDYNGTDWVQVGQTLEGLAENDYLGVSVSITGDGTIVAVGGDGDDLVASAAGHTRIFYYNAATGLWELITELLGQLAGDDFGRPVRFSRDGNRLAIGAGGHDSERGQVRIFEAFYPPPFDIIMQDDGSGKYDIQADISMDPMPTGATGHKITFNGDMDGNTVTDALIYAQNPSVGPDYRTDDGAPSTNAGAPDNFTAFWRSGSIPPTSGWNGRDTYFIRTVDGFGFVGTVTIQPIDASNNPVGPVSNTVNIVLDEDG